MQTVSTAIRAHSLFKALDPAAASALADCTEEVSAESGSLLARAGEKIEALYILTEGETLAGDNRRYLPGDYFFAEALAGPVVPAQEWRAVTSVRALRIGGRRFRFFLERFPRSVRLLRPRRNRNGDLVSGLPEGTYRSLLEIVRRKRRKRISPVVLWKGRTSLILTGIRLFLPLSASAILAALSAIHSTPGGSGEPALPLSRIYAAGALLSLFLAAAILIHRSFTLFRVLEDSLEMRRFRLRSYTATVMRVPFDQIQGTEVSIKGLFRKAFGIGTVRIQTSAREGGLEFRDIDRPLPLKNRIATLAADNQRVNRDLTRADLRQAVENHYGLREGFTLVSGKSDRELGLPEKAPVHDPVTFRKSLFVLVRALAPPTFFLAAGGAALAALYLTGKITLPILPLLPVGVMIGAAGVALWRWLDWSNDLFRIEGGMVIDIDRKPFGRSESRKQIELASAQNILSAQQGFLAWLFDFGDVRVVTPGGSSDICFESVSHPAEVQRTLFRARELWLKSLEQEQDKQRVEEILAVNDEIRRAENQRSTTENDT